MFPTNTLTHTRWVPHRLVRIFFFIQIKLLVGSNCVKIYTFFQFYYQPINVRTDALKSLFTKIIYFRFVQFTLLSVSFCRFKSMSLTHASVCARFNCFLPITILCFIYFMLMILLLLFFKGTKPLFLFI